MPFFGGVEQASSEHVSSCLDNRGITSTREAEHEPVVIGFFGDLLHLTYRMGGVGSELPYLSRLGWSILE
jgi:hypothetical protein